jgi:Amt family ammonium transporter
MTSSTRRPVRTLSFVSRWSIAWNTREATLGSNFGLGHGHVDFAGSSVVHMVGGVAATAGAIVLGPRIGKFTKSGDPIAIPGHDIPMAITGTFILAFGWFGFNPGSTLAGGDLRIGVVAVNTMMAGTAGALSAMCFVWPKFGKPDPGMMVNGMLAGLVAITRPCAFVNSVSAVVIGGVAGVLVVVAVLFIERTLKIDDPVGAIAFTASTAPGGALARSLCGWHLRRRLERRARDGEGLFYGDASQFAAQCVGMLTCIVWVFVTFYVFFRVLDRIIGNRVSAEVELEGLDMAEMGAMGYPDFVLTQGPTAGGS